MPEPVAQVQMPKYRCHKEVWALKIAEVHYVDDENGGADNAARLTPVDAAYGSILVDPEYVKKHDPQPGGYYVVYKDGYKSFSPAEAFEEGYTFIHE